MCVQCICGVLCSDKLKVVFIVEFLCGKSELINVIFFVDFGCCILLLLVGWIMMCLIELMYDESYLLLICLLLIEMCLYDVLIVDFCDVGSYWLFVLFDLLLFEGMFEVFCYVVEIVCVFKEEVEQLGFYNDVDLDVVFLVDVVGMVEVLKWCYVIINFLYLMFKQGLVILDMLGLNVIGIELELMLCLILDVYVVVFVLVVDVGVIKSDLEFWCLYVGGGQCKGCIVVFNKVDGLWDLFKFEEEVESEVSCQIMMIVQVFDIDVECVYLVLVQKGFVVKVSYDYELLVKSWLLELELVLLDQLILQCCEIVIEQV